MVDHHTSRLWARELSKPGHGALLIRSSGDDYKSATLHCTGSAHPFDEDDPGDCGWTGPNVRPGRWHEKQIGEAFARHVEYVTEHGPIVHGAEGNSPGICRCWWCRNQVTPDQASTDTGSYPLGGEDRG